MRRFWMPKAVQGVVYERVSSMCPTRFSREHRGAMVGMLLVQQTKFTGR